MEHLQKLEALRIDPQGNSASSGDEARGRLSPVASDSNKNTNSTTAVVSAVDLIRKAKYTFQIGSNLNGEPNWIVNKDNQIFDSLDEKWEATACLGPQFRANSPFFNHPVRYLPEDAAGTKDAYRTVMIDGIPTGSTMSDVLKMVKGGSLESIQLFPPLGEAMPSMSARVVFNYEKAALNMVKNQDPRHGQAQDVNRFKVNGTIVRCWMPTDPTYPRTAELERAVLGSAHATRLISIGCIDEFIFDAIPHMFPQSCQAHVINYLYYPEGQALIEFSDVRSAIKAMKDLQSERELWGARIDYQDDYCRTPYTPGEGMGA
jgi:hypothetical protein